METSFEQKSSTLGALKIVLTEEDYKAGVDKKIKEYSRKAVVKGFRPGHVPVGYIKKIYGKSLLVDEVINTVSKQVTDYIKANSLRVVGDPLPNEEAYQIDWDTDTTFAFEYEVGMASEFSVDVENLPTVQAYKIEASEERVNEAIEDLKKRFGKDIEPETSEMGDLLFGKLTQAESGYESQSGIPTDKVKADLQEKFVGLTAESTVKFDIQSLFEDIKSLGFATGKSDEDAAAMQGEFEFTVEKISRVTPAELGQELFDKVLGEGKASNDEEFRAELKKIIEENYVRESDFLLDFEVEKSLLATTNIELPDEFLKRWLFRVNEGKFMEEEIEKDYDAFARGLRLDLIRTEVADKNKDDIKVEFDDVVEVVKAEIRGYFGGQGFEGMEDFIDQMARKRLKENKDNEFRNYFNKAFGNKVLAFVRSKTKVDTKNVSVEEFNQVAQETYA